MCAPSIVELLDSSAVDTHSEVRGLVPSIACKRGSMKGSNRGPGALVLCLLTAACGISISTNDLDPDLAFDPVPPKDVRIFQATGDVPKPYVKLYLLHARSSSWKKNTTDLLNKMRQTGARLGCNGIVLEGEAGTASKLFFGPSTDAVCLRYGKDVPRSDSSADGANAASGPRLRVVEF